jgi:hypothetical protein
VLGGVDAGAGAVTGGWATGAGGGAGVVGGGAVGVTATGMGATATGVGAGATVVGTIGVGGGVAAAFALGADWLVVWVGDLRCVWADDEWGSARARTPITTTTRTRTMPSTFGGLRAPVGVPGVCLMLSGPMVVPPWSLVR